MFLKVIDTCNDHSAYHLVKSLKNIIKVSQIIGIVILVLLFIIMVINFIKKTNNKKLFHRLIISIIVLLFIVILPIIINSIMIKFDDSQFEICWNMYNYEVKLDNKYSNTNKDRNTKVGGVNITKRIFVGDSRTVHMYAYLTDDWAGSDYSSGGVHVVDDDVFISESGEGLVWLKGIGIPKATKYMDDGTALIILMGVNDLYNLNEYINYINTNYSNWTSKGVTVYFVSVNPCDGSYASELNKHIDIFNKGMKKTLSSDIRYIDTYNYLIKTGYNSPDGLHYNEETSKKIYNYIINNL